MKIEQIAYGAKNPQKVIDAYVKLGINEWTKDVVTAEGTVFGHKALNVAELYFNYQLGFELEILCYVEGRNWHSNRNPTSAPVFQSHLGRHATSAEMRSTIEKMKAINIGIAQEVFTLKHTNPVIAGKRKYHYVVFDSIAVLGYDLKLIERIYT